MLSLILYWFSNATQSGDVRASVVVDYNDIEAVYLPPDWTGPIIAIPADDNYFQ